MTNPDRLDEYLAFAIDAARAAGKLQMEGLSSRPAITLKGPKELVTPVDHACEALIIERIQAAYPDHGYFAEEGHVRPGALRWIVDPIDGTTNYAQRLPQFSVSIGLEEVGRGLIVGVVLAPYLDELFYGRLGGGAFLERAGARRRLEVARTDRLCDAVLSTGFAYVQNETANNNLDNWTRLSTIARALRRGGSAALDLAYVADGRFDGFWEMHLQPYDVAAGGLLVREAGGRVTDMFLHPDHWLEGRSLIATNGHIHAELARELATVKPDAWVRRPT